VYSQVTWSRQMDKILQERNNPEKHTFPPLKHYQNTTNPHQRRLIAIQARSTYISPLHRWRRRWFLGSVGRWWWSFSITAIRRSVVTLCPTRDTSVASGRTNRTFTMRIMIRTTAIDSRVIGGITKSIHLPSVDATCRTKVCSKLTDGWRD